MTIILVIDKSGTIKEVNLKSYNKEELYKKAGFKVTDGFVVQTKWGVEINSKKYSILLYAKTKGRAGQENKYDFPPPVDNALYYGSCVLVNISQSEGHHVEGVEDLKVEDLKVEDLKVEDLKVEDLTESLWEKIYEKLFGGFEDIGSEDSEESKDTVEDLPRTKSGYIKDDFIVDSDVSDDVDTSESEEEPVKEKQTKNKKPIKKTVFESIDTNKSIEVPTELNYTVELIEEEYL